jgi:hypothetical protein
MVTIVDCPHFSTSKPKVFTFMNMTTIEEILPPEGFDWIASQMGLRIHPKVYRPITG